MSQMCASREVILGDARYGNRNIISSHIVVGALPLILEAVRVMEIDLNQSKSAKLFV